MRALRNAMENMLRLMRQLPWKDAQAYFDVDEIRKAQRKKEQTISEARELARRNDLI